MFLHLWWIVDFYTQVSTETVWLVSMVPVRRSGISSRRDSEGWRDPPMASPTPTWARTQSFGLEGGTCSCSEPAHARPHERLLATWLAHSPNATTSSNEKESLRHLADVVNGARAQCCHWPHGSRKVGGARWTEILLMMRNVSCCRRIAEFHKNNKNY